MIRIIGGFVHSTFDEGGRGAEKKGRCVNVLFSTDIVSDEFVNIQYILMVFHATTH